MGSISAFMDFIGFPSWIHYLDDLGYFIIIFGSGALSGKMLLVSIVENNKIDDYLGQVMLSKG